jgi:hypothetical protein
MTQGSPISEGNTSLAREPTSREIRIAIALTAALLFGRLILPAVTPEVTDFRAHYAAGFIVREGKESSCRERSGSCKVSCLTGISSPFSHPAPTTGWPCFSGYWEVPF